MVRRRDTSFLHLDVVIGGHRDRNKKTDCRDTSPKVLSLSGWTGDLDVFCFFFFNFLSSEMTICYLRNNYNTHKMSYHSCMLFARDMTPGVVQVCLLAVLGVLFLESVTLMSCGAQAACLLFYWKETETS